MSRMQAMKSQQGVMLLEALVAILIFSIGIIAVMGMQAVSITQVSQSKYRTDASYLANQIIGQMWTDPANIGLYASPGGPRTQWDATVKSTLPQGQGDIAVVKVGTGGTATVTVSWKMPDDLVRHKFVTVANINPSL
jgi:type IV pilus assembly protein PilV